MSGDIHLPDDAELAELERSSRAARGDDATRFQATEADDDQVSSPSTSLQTTPQRSLAEGRARISSRLKSGASSPWLKWAGLAAGSLLLYKLVAR